MAQIITFDKLPEAVAQLADQLAEVKELILTISQPVPEPKDRRMSVQEAAEFLGLKPATIYAKVFWKELPFSKRGKRLYFSEKELTEYIQRGRRLTNDEIDQRANNYLRGRA
jgi:excisionase family DNA binding protein